MWHNLEISKYKLSFCLETLLSRHYSIPTTSRESTKATPKMNGHPKNGKIKANGSVDYYGANSIISRETDLTYIGSNPSTSFTTNYVDNSSIASNGGGSSQMSLLHENSSTSSQSTVNALDDDDFLLHYSEIPGVLAIGDATTNLIFQGKIGSVRNFFILKFYVRMSYVLIYVRFFTY